MSDSRTPPDGTVLPRHGGRIGLPLSAPRTRLLGRDGALESLVQLIGRRDVGIVTLTGPGGVGKTRLALACFSSVVEEFENGGAAVSLAGLAPGGDVFAAAADSLGLEEPVVTDGLAAVKRFLRDKHLLLLLDNFEHVLAGAEGVSEIARECPGVKVIVTSRVPLDLDGEYQFPVHPLGMPPVDLPAAGDGHEGNGQRFAAVQLFLERAAASSPGLRFDGADSLAVASLCRRLDGIPLAIELAAARMRSLTIGELTTRLAIGQGLLARSGATVESRHQSLTATLDWSYLLLPEPERTIFRRLAAFADGWTTAAAEAVCSGIAVGRAAVIVALGRLVDHSLVVFEGERGDGRYHFLETIRHYALEKLEDEGEEDSARDAHLDWCLSFAEEAKGALRSRDTAEWYGRVQEERANIREAAEWALRDADPPLRLMRLVGALGEFWRERGQLAETTPWAAKGIERSNGYEGIERIDVLDAAGLLALLETDLGPARAHFAESLRLARNLGDVDRIVGALHGLGRVDTNFGRAEEACLELKEALAFNARATSSEGRRAWREIHLLISLAVASHGAGHLEDSVGYNEQAIKAGLRHGLAPFTGAAINNLGDSARYRDDWQAARKQYELALANVQERGVRRAKPIVLLNLALVARHTGDAAGAARYVRQVLEAQAEMGIRIHTWPAFGILPGILLLAGRAAEGAQALAWADRHNVLHCLETPFREQDREALRAALGDTAFAAAYRGAETVGEDEAIQLAEQFLESLLIGGGAGIASPKSATAFNEVLTRREIEVLKLVASGNTNAEIAGLLTVSANTVERHITHLYGKIGARNKSDATAYAIEHGLRQT